jgi:hypothetical protein
MSQMRSKRRGAERTIGGVRLSFSPIPSISNCIERASTAERRKLLTRCRSILCPMAFHSDRVWLLTSLGRLLYRWSFAGYEGKRHRPCRKRHWGSNAITDCSLPEAKLSTQSARLTAEFVIGAAAEPRSHLSRSHSAGLSNAVIDWTARRAICSPKAPTLPKPHLESASEGDTGVRGKDQAHPCRRHHLPRCSKPRSAGIGRGGSTALHQPSLAAITLSGVFGPSPRSWHASRLPRRSWEYTGSTQRWPGRKQVRRR